MKLLQIQCKLIKFHAKTKINIHTGGKNHIQTACFKSTLSEIVNIKETIIGITIPKTNAIT